MVIPFIAVVSRMVAAAIIVFADLIGMIDLRSPVLSINAGATSSFNDLTCVLCFEPA
jgi:hypothetical protein